MLLYIALGKFGVIQDSLWTSSCGSAKCVHFTDRKIVGLAVSVEKKKDPWQDQKNILMAEHT